MSSNPSDVPPPRVGGGLSLYANLLEPDRSSASASPTADATAGTVTRAPILFKSAENAVQADEAAAKKQPLNSSLRFQPMKRPQPVTQKAKPKQTFPKPVPQEAVNTQDQRRQKSPPSLSQSLPTKSTLAEWAAADDEGFYEPEKRQRGGRKRRKKNKEREEWTAAPNWDDIYDPTRPNSYDEYRNSEEEVREVREWKDRLYAHRMTRRGSSDVSDEEDARPFMNRQFAPPSNFSFAPPPIESSPPPPPPAPPQPSLNLSLNESGDDAYTRRLRMAQGTYQQPAEPAVPKPPPPPPPPTEGIISRAPVRYSLPEAPADIPASEAELAEALAEDEDYEEQEQQGEDESTKPSKRPGQKGFAERLMQKYGWSKGKGLGAEGTGITTALQVKVEKRRKRPDAEGGGFADPSARGKIVGGKKSAAGKAAEEGKFGAMSEVVMLKGMVDGMDLDAELAGDGTGGGLMQEIGEECGEKYGRVERVYIHRQNNDINGIVFVKFTSQLSALRAVNALEGRIFNGNAITAKFFDTEKFDAGSYV